MENIRAIRTDDDLAWAIAEVARYFDSQPALGTAEADRFDILSTLIEAYEDKNYAIEAPEPVELIGTGARCTDQSPHGDVRSHPG